MTSSGSPSSQCGHMLTNPNPGSAEIVFSR